MQKIEFRAMGCQMSAFVDSRSHAAAQALAQVPAWFEEWEQALSRFRPDSELSRLNARGGQAVPVSPTLFAAVGAALEAAHRSQGLVSPTLLPYVEQAGYDRSFERLPAGETAPTMAREAPPTMDAWQAIRLDEARRTVHLPAGTRLDLGGSAKGWAAQQALERLQALGPALVDAGGDIAVSGPQADGRPWPVAVADPLQAQENLGLLMLEKCGVATSGIDYRRWLSGGAWKHHIIDPRTGQPADTDLMSVTVVAGDVLQAETAAKQAMILGSRVAREWLEGRPDLTGILALQDGQVFYTQSEPDEQWSAHVAEDFPRL